MLRCGKFKNWTTWVCLAAMWSQALLPTWADEESLRRQVRAYRTQNCAYWIASAGELSWSVIRERAVLAVRAIDAKQYDLAADALNHPGMARVPADYLRMINGFTLLAAQEH